MAASGPNADYETPAALKERSALYNDSRPYTQLLYEPSPLARVNRTYGPGEAWYANGKYSGTEYGANTATGETAAKIYRVDANGKPVEHGLAAGEAHVTKRTDEDGHTVYVFTDRLERKILERMMDEGKAHDTYFVYDDLDNLRFVLQPMYQEQNDLDLYAFCYKYDGRRNCIEKKLPGASPILYEYDQADRLVFSQDGNQRANNKWTYYLYDKLDRLTEQGECTGKNTASGKTVWLKNHYDNYDFRSQAGFNNSNFPAGNSYGKGFLTGQELFVTGNESILYLAYYYDIRGRITKTVQSNLPGGYDVTSTVYTFTDQPAMRTHTHSAPGKTTQTEVYTYTYDHADRLTKVQHKLGSGSTVTLSSYTYDELGRLQTKTPHDLSTNRLTYSYNLRGWLTGISGTRLTQNLLQLGQRHAQLQRQHQQPDVEGGQRDHPARLQVCLRRP